MFDFSKKSFKVLTLFVLLLLIAGCSKKEEKTETRAEEITESALVDLKPSFGDIDKMAERRTLRALVVQ